MAVAPLSVYAQNLSLTITPPLFQVGISPGDTWTSGLTVVNTNPYDIIVYADVANFEALGEGGRGNLIPVPSLEEGEKGYTLGHWITITDQPILIPREQTHTIPFSVKVPEGASPGGHYASILISNEEPERAEGNAVAVTSSIASLVFLNVAGAIEEKGLIREFSADKSFYQSTEAGFTMRFQNLGNVHIQPQGHITILNMWGKERGKISVNPQTEFGNVLPGSIRKFEFTWKGTPSLYDIGPYKAIATLSYGNQAKQSVTRETAFWILPIFTALKVFGTAFAFIVFLVFVIRRYVRRALLLETQRLSGTTLQTYDVNQKQALPAQSETLNAQHPQVSLELKTLIRPLQRSAVDLRSLRGAPGVVSDADEVSAPTLTISAFFKRYYLFFISVGVIAIGIVGASAYFDAVLTYESDFEVTVQRSDGSEMTIDSEAGESEIQSEE